MPLRHRSCTPARRTLTNAVAAVGVTLVTTAAAVTAHAAEFRSVGANPAVMYDAPSEKARKLAIAPRGMPVEVILAYGEWSKVRDASGDLSWMPVKVLTPKRHLVVSVPSAKVHAGADESSGVLFTAERNVLLEMTEPMTSGWVRVRHADGQAGYVRAADVWGE